MNWVICPWVNQSQRTAQAVDDWLNQDIGGKVLLIGNNVKKSDLKQIEILLPHWGNRVLLWDHNPALPSLSATWNFALDFVWGLGNTHALVANNDIRVRANLYRRLKEELESNDALLVSAIGVTEEQFKTYVDDPEPGKNKGGPGFSCFLASKEFHRKYRFDENFIPAYTEDVDTHRRVMLAGEGHRIYNINAPYLHYGSGTLQSMTPEERVAVEAQINGISRKHFEEKWGGPVNEERYLEPFGQIPQGPDICVTTPQLQRHGCRGRH